MLLKVLSPDAKLPTRGSKEAAGLDLYSCDRHIIEPGKSKLIGTGIAISVGSGNAGFVWARSKLGARYNLQVQAGVIDADYTGEIMVSLYNAGEHEYRIEKGDAIAQLVVKAVVSTEYSLVNELKCTDRGEAGINSFDERRQGS